MKKKLFVLLVLVVVFPILSLVGAQDQDPVATSSDSSPADPTPGTVEEPSTQEKLDAAHARRDETAERKSRAHATVAELQQKLADAERARDRADADHAEAEAAMIRAYIDNAEDKGIDLNDLLVALQEYIANRQAQQDEPSS